MRIVPMCALAIVLNGHAAVGRAQAKEAPSLEEALEDRLQAWDRLVARGEGSAEALEIVRRYHAEMDSDGALDPQRLAKAVTLARHRKDRLGEVITSLLLARDHLVVADERTRAPKPVAGSPQTQVSDGREHYLYRRVSAWDVIPRNPLMTRTGIDDTASIRQAERLLAEALGLVNQLNDLPLATALHRSLAEYWYSGRDNSAQQHGQRALELFGQQGFELDAGRVRVRIAEAYTRMGRLQEALDHLMESLKAPGDDSGASRTFRGVPEIPCCSILPALSSARKEVEDCYEQCLRNLRGEKRTPSLAITLSAQAGWYERVGLYDRALDMYKESLALFQQLDDIDGMDVQISMSGVYESMGQFNTALQVQRQAIEAYRGHRHAFPYEIAHALARSATLAAYLGCHNESLRDLVAALAVFADLRFDSDVSDDLVPVLSRIGDLLRGQGKAPQAVAAYEQALRLGGGLQTVVDLVDVEASRGDMERARRHLADAMRRLATVRANSQPQIKMGPAFVNTLVSGLKSVGEAHLRVGNHAEASDLLGEYLQLTAPDPDSYERAMANAQLARAQFAQKAYGPALRSSLEAIRILEEFDKRMFLAGRETGADYVRTTLAAVYDLAIALQINQGHPEEAFRLTAAAKNQVLRAMVRRHELAFESVAAQALWHQRNDLLWRMSALQVEIQRSTQQGQNQPAAELARLEEALNDTERDLSRETAAYSKVFGTAPTEITDVQAALDTQTAVIQYAMLGDGLAFVLRRGGFAAVPLPEGAAIAKAIGTFRSAQRAPDWRQQARAYEAPARELHRLLIAPLAGQLPSTIRRLVIIADGDLNLLPFEGLVDSRGRFLLQDYAVSYANTVGDLLTKPSRRGDGVLAYGGARYSTRLSPKAAAPATRSSPACGDGRWPQLGGTSREARDVARLFGGRPRTGSEATEARFKREVAGKRYLLVSSHGYFADCGDALESDPLASSGVVFSGANAGGDGVDDGYLTALEVLGLDLRGVELAVLSACDTGVGQVHASEGVIGLKRSFFAAGAESLLLSLWKVPDNETRDLVVRFFRRLKAGETKVEALRGAKLDLIRAGKTLPYYWSSFVLVGAL